MESKEYLPFEKKSPERNRHPPSSIDVAESDIENSCVNRQFESIMTSKWGADTTGAELVKEFAAEIKGKAILVTGVTPGGLGAIFAETIAKAQPSTIVLAGRNKDKIKATTDAIQSANPDVKVKVLELDLGSFSAVRRAAETINSWDDVPHIDVLVNNAGIMAVDFGLTEDGFERQFGTNHLGPFLFTNLIMGKIRASDMPRIIVVSSDGHRLGVIRWTDYNYGVGSARANQR